MSDIQPFSFEGNDVRTIAEGDEVLFVASDIAKILGYRDAATLTRTLDDEEKGTRPIDTLGGIQQLSVISEPGLYKAILQRQTGRMEVEVTKAFVKRFQRWVTHEVLPTIRKHGAYATEATIDRILANPDFGIKLLTDLKEERDKRTEAENQVRELEPKALFADAVAASDGTCLMGELAKMLRQNGLDIGQNRLFRLLRDDGFLGKSGANTNVPTQKAMELGLFRIKETAVTHSDGHVTISRTPKVTGKGQRYFINRYGLKHDA